MFLFSLGLSMTFLVLGLGMVSASQLPRSGAWLGHVHKISSALLFMAGGYYLFLGLKGW
jgi:thiol:disulfide interchange protein